nr:MAG TPA: hypothetical protein [Caudoviricetes sp.]
MIKEVFRVCCVRDVVTNLKEVRPLKKKTVRSI